MPNHIPYDLYALDSYSLAYHSHARFKRLVEVENMPTDIIEQVEDNILPALEYIINWEPTDAEVQSHIDSRGVL